MYVSLPYDSMTQLVSVLVVKVDFGIRVCGQFLPPSVSTYRNGVEDTWCDIIGVLVLFLIFLLVPYLVLARPFLTG